MYSVIVRGVKTVARWPLLKLEDTNKCNQIKENFSHAGTIFCPPVLNQYYATDEVFYSRKQHSDSARGKLFDIINWATELRKVGVSLIICGQYKPSVCLCVCCCFFFLFFFLGGGRGVQKQIRSDNLCKRPKNASLPTRPHLMLMLLYQVVLEVSYFVCAFLCIHTFCIHRHSNVIK